MSARSRLARALYGFRNPESSDIGSSFTDLELKNAWVVRHDGLLFGSGWYITADQFAEYLVSIVVSKFRSEGLPTVLGVVYCR